MPNPRRNSLTKKFVRTTAKKLYVEADDLEVTIAGLELDDHHCYDTVSGCGGQFVRTPTPTLDITFRISKQPPFSSRSNCDWSYNEFAQCLSITNQFTLGLLTGAGADAGYRLGYLKADLHRESNGDLTFTVDIVNTTGLATSSLFRQRITPTDQCSDLTFGTNDNSTFLYQDSLPLWADSPSCTAFGVPCQPYPSAIGVLPTKLGKNGTVTITKCSTLPFCGLRHIISVESTCTNTIVINFDGQVTLDDFGLKLAFYITPAAGGGPYYLTTGTGVQVTTTQIEFDVDGSYVPVIGDRWDLVDNPEWLHNGASGVLPATLQVVAHPVNDTISAGPAVCAKIIAVTSSGTGLVTIDFDQAITCNGNVTSGAFDINGTHTLVTGPTGAIQTGAAQVTVVVNGYTPLAGDTWNTSAPLEWINELTAYATSGTVT